MSTRKSNAEGTLIHVTQEIIDTAKAKDSNHCMIADAIQAALPNVRNVAVDLQSIRFTIPEVNRRVIYFTPLVCQHQLIRFDQGDQTISPWQFRLPSGTAQTTYSSSAAKSARAKARAGQTKEKETTEASSSESVEDGAVMVGLADSGSPRLNRKYVQKFGNGQIQVLGGTAPPIATLAGGPGVGPNVGRGKRRTFGVRSAGLTDLLKVLPTSEP